MNPVKRYILMHTGMPRRSGRYPWGSGENPNQHSGDLISRVASMEKKGMSRTEIARNLGMSTTDFRTQMSIANANRRAVDVATAKALKAKGLSLNQIAEKMGYRNDSSVRSLLDVDSEARMHKAKNTADFIKSKVDEKGMILISAGTEKELNVSREKMMQALQLIKDEGYEVYPRRVAQVTNPGKYTTVKIACPPGTPYKEVYNLDKINTLKEYTSRDGGDTFDTFKYPKSMDSKRIEVRYKEDGGDKKDGVIEIRKGVEDLSLGKSHYAQVRILVDGTHYIKGMAVYSDNLPEGKDIVFNTNKKIGTPMIGEKGNSILKPIEKDPDNPFGSLIKAGGQSDYIDKNGQKQMSLINKRAEEGDWGEWAKELPSQFLAKQKKPLIEKQLNLAAADKQAEFEDIKALTNPTVKKILLKSFSEDCDAAAVHLQAAALPRQKYQVILPVKTMKETEVYAPNFEDGEKIALVRFPHGGTFEIPILTVNIKNAEAKRVLGTTPADAIGINSKVAEVLSGADFDGDTVMVIPVGRKVQIHSSPPLKGLQGFDPKMAYPAREGMKVMKNTQNEMGKISNLITDMTLKGAVPEELARAVRHSMVVIDAEKHKLNYKQSEIDNGIASLKKRYQGTTDEDGSYHEGSATLISRAKSPVLLLKTKGQPWINPETGEKEWERINPKTGKKESKIVREEYEERKKVIDPETGKVVIDPVTHKPIYVSTGKIKVRMKESTRMAETKDAHTLSSGTVQEEIYADYANKMKALGNAARKEMISTGKIVYSASAKDTYQKEVDSLDTRLNVALKNAPREARAQVLANAEVAAKKLENPDMKPGEIKTLSQQALTKARIRVGAQRVPIKITDREWEAIQAGAISENKLTKILNNTDIDEIRQRATPRTRSVVTAGKENKINAMKQSGYTTAEIAKAVSLSSSTVSKYLQGKG